MLAKNFASKLAPAIGKASNRQSGIMPSGFAAAPERRVKWWQVFFCGARHVLFEWRFWFGVPCGISSKNSSLFACNIFVNYYN